MNKKHYVIYFDENINQAVTKTSREWARDNQNHFPDYDFIESIPTSNTIDHFLVDELGYTLISDDEKFVCFKLTN
ncbi:MULTISPECIES: hypothetical protein [unclassified Flavobacterium]|jgi:hypothetical protein|uniref:hypothetical protein n=1 Tax=unclassified Flavobacterium TaxID=196869 RepID=UPI0025C5135A|nr:MULTISPECIES: hypothetical protein [unclassified Flavobacterium]